jgi:hypothetical protein
MNTFAIVLSATAVSGILSFVANHALAQSDYFNATGDPLTAATCEARYQAAIKQVQQDETTADIKYKEENRNCNAGGSGDTSCFRELRTRMAKEGVEFGIRKIDAEAIHDICMERERRLANPGVDICEQIYQSEMERLTEENILDQAKLKKDNLVCNLGAGNKCTNPDKQLVSNKFRAGNEKAAAERRLCGKGTDVADAGKPREATPQPPSPSCAMADCGCEANQRGEERGLTPRAYLASSDAPIPRIAGAIQLVQDVPVLVSPFFPEGIKGLLLKKLLNARMGIPWSQACEVLLLKHAPDLLATLVDDYNKTQPRLEELRKAKRRRKLTQAEEGEFNDLIARANDFRGMIKQLHVAYDATRQHSPYGLYYPPSGNLNFPF